MSHGITWFEIPVTGWSRAKKFYQTLLNVDIEEREIGHSLMGILGTPEDGINGAIVLHEWYIPSEHGVLLYFDAGENLNPMLARAEAAGATVLIPKTHVSEEIGYMAAFRDTEGNRIALHSRS